ncbi:MAG: hypothetical protein JXA67_16540 [Micromonosporaceae bacterium]|nr:hypothetical protein [Micromonosporaceae bacterium]
MDITMNVIYTPGTLALARFVPLLVEHTPWRFRLVANHCTLDEQRILAQAADSSDRLSTLVLDTTEVLPLGKALTALVAGHPHEETFAFMDSDILVTADIAGEFEPLLHDHEAVFSGTPIWAEPTDQVVADGQREISGPHNRTADGLPLGSSYFGIFHRPTLDRVMTECQVVPDKYTGTSTCAAPFRAFLAEHGLADFDFVPPKVVNLAYSFLGLPICYHETPNLVHIGGFSMAAYARMVDTPEPVPAYADEILAFVDDRPHMRRKRAVNERVTRSFAQIDTTGTPWREISFPEPLESRVRLVEDTYLRLGAPSHPGA